MAEWKDWIEIWKQDMKDSLDEWKDMMNKWRSETKERKFQLSLPPMPHLRFHPPRTHRIVDRPKVVASRISVEELSVIDMLIESGLFTTRSEAVNFLVREGIKARRDILEKVKESLEEIRRIRKDALEFAQKLRDEIGIGKATKNQSADKKRPCSKCNRSLDKLPGDITICPYCGLELEN